MAFCIRTVAPVQTEAQKRNALDARSPIKSRTRFAGMTGFMVQGGADAMTARFRAGQIDAFIGGRKLDWLCRKESPDVLCFCQIADDAM